MQDHECIVVFKVGMKYFHYLNPTHANVLKISMNIVIEIQVGSFFSKFIVWYIFNFNQAHWHTADALV